MIIYIILFDESLDPKKKARWEAEFNAVVKFETKQWAESTSFKKCMSCPKAPTVEILWANGKGHAWFCDQCFKAWKKKPNKMSDTGTNDGDVNKVRKVENGEASRKWSK